MKEYPCLKIYQLIPLIKKLEKIKLIIKDCYNIRNIKIENIFRGDLADKLSVREKKNFVKELDHKLETSEAKYNKIHKELYGVIDEIYGCECCINKNMICKGGSMCLKIKDNKKLWDMVDKISVTSYNFYDEIESMLVIETELCLYKLNKINKIKFFN